MTKYTSKCFDLNSKCADAQRSAAILDYIGATRGENGKVKFDGQLTEEEKTYVESKFGAIPELSSEGIDTYILNANEVFFTDIIEGEKKSNPQSLITSHRTQDCEKNSESFKAVKHQNPELGSALVLGGLHYCANIYGRMYLQEELKVAAHPEKYYFGLEGNRYLKERESMTVLEVKLLERIAEALDIPTGEATPFRTSDSRSIELASKNNNVPKAEYWAAALFRLQYLEATYNYKMAAEKGVQDTLPWDRFWDSKVDEFVKEYGLNDSQKQELRKAMFDLVELKPGEDGRLYFNPASVYADGSKGAINTGNRLLELASASNQLSTPVIKQDLKNSGKKNAVFLIGEMHHSLLAEVYRTPLQLPKNLEVGLQAFSFFNAVGGFTSIPVAAAITLTTSAAILLLRPQSKEK